MNIDIICRVRWDELFERMKESALKTVRASTLGFLCDADDGQPRLSQSFNKLGPASQADILIFIDEDVEFLSEGWDIKIIEALQDYDVVGAIGAKEYYGGRVFDAGIYKCRGKYATVINGFPVVKVMAPTQYPEEVKVIDGLILAVTAKYFRDHKFDEKLDGLFFHDLDYCLGAKCCVVDILLSHNKPAKYYGLYPADMKPIGAFWDYFHAKHGLDPQHKPESQVCHISPLKQFQDLGEEKTFALAGITA